MLTNRVVKTSLYDKITLTIIIIRKSFPAGLYLLKVNNRNSRAKCETCSKLTIKIPFFLSTLLQTKKVNLLWKELVEAVARRCSVKKVFLEILQNSQENTCASLFFNKVADSGTDVSCEFCKIYKNTFSYRTPRWVLLSSFARFFEIFLQFTKTLSGN